MVIRYLNVDLEIENHQDLQPLVYAFGEDVIMMYCGLGHSHFMASVEASITADANTIIDHLCDLVDNLQGYPKELWNSSFRKVFDIGYESGLEPRSYASEIDALTISRVAKIGASIRITINPPYIDDDQKHKDFLS